jgi:hypothetical protein
MNCTICNERLDPVLESSGTHPNCFPFAELDEGDPFATMVKTKLIQMIQWAENEAPRSKQTALGVSDISVTCDRRLGYRIAEVPATNVDMDKWPAIVGTSIHAWMERAVNSWMRFHDRVWDTEATLRIDDLILGHADLYSREHAAVIDYKTASSDVMRKVRKDGPPEHYQIQIQLYGYGFEQTGQRVDKVCLVFLPRAGWLKDSHVWCTDYNRDLAVMAINRVYAIAQQLVNLETSIHPHRWEQVTAHPSNECGWCPLYDPGRPLELGADDKGCPGR